VEALNAKVLQCLSHYEGLDSMCMTKTNKRRHHINRLQMRRFAEALRQDIYVFPAAHTRTKKKHRDLLGIQGGEGNVKGPGPFLYTKGMPITILYNTCTL